MLQASIRQELTAYLDKNPATENAEVLRALIASNDDLFARGDSLAHVTASAWILNEECTHALLIEHAKYFKFCPPGGHIDPFEMPIDACLREAGEEVGLKKLQVIVSEIFDIDIHRIPASAKKNEPAHWHIDVRYALMANNSEAVDLNLEECLSHQWKALSEMVNGDDASLARLSTKTFALKR
jgi:8-oxo-dGTP pyrophosphatase MutT (NUDIX family)